MPAASSVHEFGSFRLDSAERLLLRDGQPVSLTPKAFDLLVYLVDHAGRLVTKQALMSALWPNSFVEEANLTFTVSALRKALGDGQDGEQFIQTVPHADTASWFPSLAKEIRLSRRRPKQRLDRFRRWCAVLALPPWQLRSSP